MMTPTLNSTMRSTWQRLAALLLASSCFALASKAVDVHIIAQKQETISLAGGFAALEDPSVTPGKLYTGLDPLGDPAFSFPVIFDSGASGNLLSNFSSSTLGVPFTGESYSDVGIGGTETFDVSKITRLKLAPIAVQEAGADLIANYSNYGEFKFQVKKQDVNVSGIDMPFDLVGTPLLNQYIMHVTPNIVEFSSLTPTLDYMHTELIKTMPALPAKGVFHIPLRYDNFVTGPVPVTVSGNPVIPNVRVIDSRKPANKQSAAMDWLLDTGGSVSIIGRDYATAIGINLATEVPVDSIDVFGVGNTQRTLNAYILDHVVIPLANGDNMVLDNFTVFVPADTNTLPADLGGIFGINNLAPSFSKIDPLLGPTDLTPTQWQEWYLNALTKELILIDPTSNYIPEPFTSFLLLPIGLLLRRNRKAKCQ